MNLDVEHIYKMDPSSILAGMDAALKKLRSSN
jgi:hypothetical protein